VARNRHLDESTIASSFLDGNMEMNRYIYVFSQRTAFAHRGDAILVAD